MSCFGSSADILGTGGHPHLPVGQGQQLPLIIDGFDVAVQKHAATQTVERVPFDSLTV
jgi:hypothetical protein